MGQHDVIEMYTEATCNHPAQPGTHVRAAVDCGGVGVSIACTAVGGETVKLFCWHSLSFQLGKTLLKGEEDATEWQSSAGGYT